ncbi:5443_t:CDS:2, partial [Entrophospora sp. SA101]
MVDEFVENFNNMDTSNYIRNVIHNKSWKENEVELLKMTEWILEEIYGVICNLVQVWPV